MSSELLVAVVAGAFTFAGVLVKSLPQNKQNEFTRLESIIERLDSDLEDTRAEIKKMKSTMEERDLNHRLERNKWNKEREKIIEENKRLEERVDKLEDAMMKEGLDPHDI